MKSIYLVYRYKGRIKVKKGQFDSCGCFHPDDNPRKWHGWNGYRPGYLEFRLGKTWCFREDVPKAVSMIVDRQNKYRKEVIRKAEIFRKEEKRCFTE